MPVSQRPAPPPPYAPDTPMLRVLGHMSVRVRGRESPVGPPLRRLLLALLVARPGQVVPAEQLIQELWGDRAPKKPLATLQSHVSHLRGVLEPLAGEGESRVLRHQAPGYTLLLPPAQVDVHRFERLVHAGRLALGRADARVACATLTDALTLWRGLPYAGFDTCPPLAHESARLEQLRLTALEHRADARLRLGDAEQVVTELDSEVRRHPVRERLAGHLMTALFALGRQAEALSVYDRTRAYLAEELGVETGTELQQTHLAILRQELEPHRAGPPVPGGEPSEAGPTAVRERSAGGPEAVAEEDRSSPHRLQSPLPPSTASTPSSPSPSSSLSLSSFVGRGRELGRLTAEAAGVLTGQEHVSCVTGPLGIGKTHLLTEFAARMAADHPDVEVVVVTAPHDPGVPPLWLWTQVLRRLSATRSVALGAASAPYEALLAPVLNGTGRRPWGETARTRFLVQDAVCEVLRALAAQRPLVLCVDDLHWADPASLGLLDMLVKRRDGWRIGLVVTVWEWRTSVDSTLRRTLADLLRGPRAGVLRLAGLPRPAFAALVRAGFGGCPEPGGATRTTALVRADAEPEAEFVECVYRVSLGNPHIARQALMWCGARCERQDAARGPDCPRAGVPALDGLRLVLARMPERERRIVRLCAVAGARVDLEPLRRAAPDEPVDPVVEQLLREEVLREDPHHPGRVRFASEPARQAFVETLTGEERHRIRQQITARAARPPQDTDLLAEHLNVLPQQAGSKPAVLKGGGV